MPFRCKIKIITARYRGDLRTKDRMNMLQRNDHIKEKIKKHENNKRKGGEISTFVNHFQYSTASSSSACMAVESSFLSGSSGLGPSCFEIGPCPSSVTDSSTSILGSDGESSGTESPVFSVLWTGLGLVSSSAVAAPRS